MNWLNRFDKTEKSVMGVTVAVLGLFAFYFYAQSLSKDSLQNLMQIGKIEVVDNDVRHKTQKTFAWSPAEQSEKVYQNDSIFTGENSRATVSLSNDTVIKVDPNSLITLSLENGQMSLDLRYGQLESALAKAEITIKSNGQEYKISSPQGAKSTIKLIKNQGGNIDVKVSSGKAQIKTSQEASPRIITPEKQATILSSGIIADKPQIQFQLLAPNKTDWALTSVPLIFKWKTSGGKVHNGRIEISQDFEFKNILRSIAPDANPYNFTEVLPEGQYFWRLTGVNDVGGGIKSRDVFTFTVAKPEPPKIEEPLLAQDLPQAPILERTNIRIPASSRSPAAVARPVIAWSQVSNAKDYIVQISKDSSSKGPVVVNQQTNTQYTWKNYKPGTYNFRVYARDAQNQPSPPSEIGQLVVEQGQISLNPVNPINQVSEQYDPQAVDLNWNTLPYAKKYKIEITNQGQSNVIPVAAPPYKLKMPTPGTYNARVIGLDEKDVAVTTYSPPQSIVFSHRQPLMPPSLMEPFNQSSIFLQSTMEPFIWLEWRKVPTATSYIIEVAADPEFAQPLIREPTNNHRFLLKNKLPLGKLYWRVQAIATSTNEKSAWTKSREFTLFHQKNETFVK